MSRLSPVLAETLQHHRGVLRLRDHPDLRGRVTRAVAGGHLVRVLPGIVAAASLASDSHALVRAVQLHDPAAILLGRTSARTTHWPRLEVPLVEASVQQRPRMRTPPGLVLHQIRWPPELLRGSGPLHPLTLAAATLWSAEHGDLTPLFAALRECVTVDDLRQTASLAPRMHREAWQRIVHEVRMAPWSHPELDLHRHLRRRGVTGWKGNVHVVAGGRNHHLDVAFERERVGIEVESREFHSEWQDLKKNWHRHNRLTVGGWRILHVDTDRVLTDPNGVIDEACALVNQRSALGRASRPPR